ncbi:ferredoxin [Limnochorda pilosa]|uniref:Ferredoxin n=1 Tax=Limnochorda pilosa TaxID=1555112 RepID=A0A0K2SR82_LIMPI|nr:ferredoxin [Limnochorda pilosa]
MELITPSGTHRLEVAEDQFILDRALQAGLDLPHTCLQGWCTTCAGRILEGEVDPSAALRYYREDREAGYVLLCTARPRGPLRIQTHQKEALRANRRKHRLPAPRA